MRSSIKTALIFPSDISTKKQALEYKRAYICRLYDCRIGAVALKRGSSFFIIMKGSRA